MSNQVKIEKFDSETNPFSIENMIKKEDTSNDSGYSVSQSEEGSDSENGFEKPMVSSSILRIMCNVIFSFLSFHR